MLPSSEDRPIAVRICFPHLQAPDDCTQMKNRVNCLSVDIQILGIPNEDRQLVWVVGLHYIVSKPIKTKSIFSLVLFRVFREQYFDLLDSQLVQFFDDKKVSFKWNFLSSFWKFSCHF